MSQEKKNEELLNQFPLSNLGPLLTPKLEFPSFDGSYPRNWFRICNQYFHFLFMEEQQKIVFASLRFLEEQTSGISITKWEETVIDGSPLSETFVYASRT